MSGEPDSPPPAPVSSSPLQRFLARHDSVCPHCGENLKGVEGDHCRACGAHVSLPAVLAVMSRARPRVALYWLDRMIVLLAGWLLLETMFESGHRAAPLISEFFMLWLLLVVARVLVAKRTPVVKPLVDPPLLVDYLAGGDVACPRCGYNLRDLTGEACPECGVKLSVEMLNAALVVERPVNVGAFARKVLGTVAVVIGAVVCGAVVFGVVEWVRVAVMPGWLMLLVVAVPGVVIAGQVWMKKGE